MNTIRDLMRDLPRVPLACAVVVLLGGVLAGASGEGGHAVLCGVVAACFVEIAVLRRTLGIAEATAAGWEAAAEEWAQATVFWQRTAEHENANVRGY